MDNLFAHIKEKIPANKFYPPQNQCAQSVIREPLLKRLITGKSPNARIVLIEAQAGQGKTSLAAQYIEQLGYASIWYQVGPEDSDPLFFLTALLCALKDKLPEFTCNLLEKMIANGDLTPSELPRYANILLHDLGEHNRKNLIIVLDDLHLIGEAGLTLGLLDYLLETAPPRLHFLLLTRHPLALDAKGIKTGKTTCRLKNHDLAMSPEEAASLLTQKMHLPLPDATLLQIHDKTDGWPMGIILAGHALQAKGQGLYSLSDAFWADFNGASIRNYFKEEVLLSVPESLHSALLRLCFLDEIPLPLAIRLSGRSDIGTELLALHKHNFFIRQLDRQGTIFGLHHLFREFLRTQAATILNPEEIADIYRHVAAYYLEIGRPLMAIQAFLAVGDHEAIEQLLAEQGMNLLAMGRTLSLATALNKISTPLLDSLPWLSFFKGVIAIDLDPPKALEFFRLATMSFKKQNAKRGELFALSMQIYYHMMCDGLFLKAESMLRRADILFDEIGERLDPYSFTFVARNLAYGFCFLDVNERKVNDYIEMAIRRINRDSLNMIATLRVIRGYTTLGLGNKHNSCVTEIEHIHDFVVNPEITFLNGLSILSLQLNLLEQTGNFEAFEYYKQRLLKCFEQNVVSKTIFGPYLLIWELNYLNSTGHYDKVLEVVIRGVQQGAAHLQPHLHSQYLHYQAYALAQKSNKEQAIIFAEQSANLRGEAGGKYFIALNDLFVGATFILIDEYERARKILDRGLAICNDKQLVYLAASLFLQRSFLNLKQGRMNAAVDDLREGLAIMRRMGYVHFYTWTPTLMKKMLAFAIKNNIETNYADMLACRRLHLFYLPAGDTFLPLLTFTTMGDFSVRAGSKQELHSQDFTPILRELMALLITAPGMKMSQDAIQLALWPDSSPTKARASFDSLLLRLRKLLKKVLTPHDVKHYLSVQKGVVYLKHCLIDAHEFHARADQGLRHYNKGEYWQASNQLHNAMQHWNGEFVPGLTVSEQMNDYRFELTNKFVRVVQAWAEILIHNKQLSTAEEVLEMALKYDRYNDLLASMLYKLLHKAQKPLKAQQVLKSYQKFLKEEGFTFEEIADMNFDLTFSR